jgi:two-component system chemotaxis response regulator CheB
MNPRRGPIGILVADDSPTVRKVLRRVFRPFDDLEVVGEAGDGNEAVTQVLELRPDVVLMDVEMPELDGFGAIESIMSRRPTPILVITSRARRDQMNTAFRALQLGALEVFPKPEVPEDWPAFRSKLVETVRSVARARPTRPSRQTPPKLAVGEIPLHRARVRHAAIGASAGGPAALRDLLAAFGGRLALGVAVVQHIVPGFEKGLAEWLAQETALDVRMARDSEELRPGAVRIGPAGGHLRLSGSGVLTVEPGGSTPRRHCPAIDELLLSCAAGEPRSRAGVLLSGMGKDGVRGLLAMRRAGGLTLVQDRATCTVFGIPSAAIEADAAELSLPPEQIAVVLTRAARGGAA